MDEGLANAACKVTRPCLPKEAHHMKFKYFIFIPLTLAVFASTLQMLDQIISSQLPVPGHQGFGWIAFIGWSLYFVAGGNIQGGKKILYGFAFGIAAAAAVLQLGSALSAKMAFYAFPLAVFLGVAVSLCLERLPPFDFIPAVFMAAAIYFCMMSYVPGTTYMNAAVTEFSYCVLGLVYGFISIKFRSKYEAFRHAQKA